MGIKKVYFKIGRRIVVKNFTCSFGNVVEGDLLKGV